MSPEPLTDAPHDVPKRSAASIIGCGCAVLVGLFLVAVVTTTLLTYRAGKKMAEVAGDPVAAAEAVREVLPYDQAPAGYHPLGNLSIPLLMDVVFLGGPDPVTDSAEWTQGFVFIRIRDWMNRGERSRESMESGDADDAPIAQEQIRFEPRETVDRGELASGAAQVTWVSRRGLVEMDISGLSGDQDKSDRGLVEVQVGDDGPQEGILTTLTIDCDEEGWQRLGLWFAPDPDPDRPAAEVDWSGTPADPAALADHLSHFDLCHTS